MQRKIPRRVVDGVLLLDKPGGMTSNGALQSARRLLNAAKAGHTGTLDPMATGLLPLTFGEATKFSQMLLDADKCYEATLRLGVDTDTGDAEGQVIAELPVTCDEARAREVIATFSGDIEQIPPMYSALKRGGKALYEYAREGIEIEREPRRVRIHELEVLACALPEIRVRARVSKGTYIRTLAMDIGQALGCGAHLTALRRVGIGPFRIDQAVALAALEATPLLERDALLAPVDALLHAYPACRLSTDETRGLLQGRVLERIDLAEGPWRIFGPEGFVGLADVDGQGMLKARRLISTQLPV